MLTIARWMVMMHHRLWAIIAVFGVGIGIVILSSYISNLLIQHIGICIGMLVIAFVLTTGVVVAPLDDWQHQHGSCLLDTIAQAKRK